MKNGFLALSLSLLAASSIACQNVPDAGGHNGPGDQPEPYVPPPAGQPGYEGKTMSCADREKIVQACNLVTTREENLKNGVKEVYEPTPACQDALASVFPLDQTWADEPESRARLLRGMHVLFFYPMAHPKDLTFIWKGSPETFTSEWTVDFGSRELPASNDLVVTRTSVNEGALDWFYGEITSITLNGSLPGSTHMETAAFAGALEVSRTYLESPEKYARAGTSWMAAPLLVARSLLHEMRHAAGAFSHDGCAKHYGNEHECDDVLMASSYGVGAQAGQALVLGAMYARVEGDSDAAPIVSSTVLQSFFLDNCEHALTKVNAVGAWVKEHQAEGVCYDPYVKYVDDAMKLRPAPKPEITRLAASAGPWTCAMSGNAIVNPKD